MEKKKKFTPLTRLSGKEYSPLVIRRVSMPFLHWVAIISDDNLDSLDEIIQKFWKDNPLKNVTTIQEMRNQVGKLQEVVISSYPRMEGCAVIFSADKMLISSLAGDFMVHEQCRLELYSLLNLSTQL
jgi:hypothetical protein